ncbi:MAG: hypothetical protein ACKOSS_00885 [Planctomycetia bacterium]
MGGGHAHDGHGHGHDSHAAADAGHGAHGGEIPPAPEVRSITPAPEDFVKLPGARALAWPLTWLVVAFLGMVALLASGWELHNMDDHGGEHGAGHGSAHEAPAAAGEQPGR